MLVEQVAHDLLELFGKFEGFDLCGVGKAIHHVCDAAVLKGFGCDLPAILDKLDGPLWIDPVCFHFFKAENGARLEEATKNSLFSHKVGFDLSYER